LASVLALGVAGAGCGSDDSSDGDSSGKKETGPITLGLLAPQTGVGSYIGQSMVDYAELAVDEVNRAGGIDGRELKLEVKDTATDARQTATAARDLVRSADFMMGPFTGIELSPALKIASDADKLLFFPTEGSYELPVCTDTLVGLGQLDSQQNIPFAKYLVEKYGRKFYFVGTDFEYPRFVADNLKDSLEEYGGELLGADFYPFATGDFSKSLRKIQSSGADVAFTVVTGNDFFTYANQFKQFGIDAQFASPGVDNLRASDLGGVVPGAETNQAWVASLDTPASRAYVDIVTRRFGDKATFAQIGESLYTGVFAYKAAVEAAGTTDTAAVRDALLDVKVEDAPQGPASFVRFGNWTQMVTGSIIARLNSSGTLDVVEDLGEQVPVDTGEVPAGCGA
jgi:ABC-type branched-subunit amino acid transport system substrate-binding protein